MKLETYYRRLGLVTPKHRDLQRTHAIFHPISWIILEYTKLCNLKIIVDCVTENSVWCVIAPNSRKIYKSCDFRVVLQLTYLIFVKKLNCRMFQHTVKESFIVAPCINNIKHFIFQLMHTNYKILRLLK